MAASLRGLPPLLLLLLLLVSGLCVSPLPVSACCLEKPSSDSILHRSAGGIESNAFSSSGFGERRDVPATVISAEVPATEQRKVCERARLRRSGRRRWVAASPVRFRNLNSQSTAGAGLLENVTRRNKTRDVEVKTLPPHYSTSEPEHLTESYQARGWELRKSSPNQKDLKSTVALHNEVTTLRAMTSGIRETEAPSVQALSTQSTIKLEEAASQRSLEVDGERSVSSKLDLTSLSSGDSETTESYVTDKQSSPLAFHLEFTPENNSLSSEKNTILTGSTVAIAGLSATTSTDSSLHHNNDTAHSSTMVPQTTVQQIVGLYGNETKERIILEQSTRGDSRPIEPPDTEQRVAEVVTPSKSLSDASDTTEQEISIAPSSQLTRLPSERLWTTTEFDHKTETSVPTTEIPAVESTSLGAMLDRAATYDILNSSQMTTQSTLKQLQGTSDAETPVSRKWLGATTDSIDTMHKPRPEEIVPLRQLPEFGNDSQENIKTKPGQSRLLSNLWEIANVTQPLAQETIDSRSTLSASTSGLYVKDITVESGSIILKSTLGQLHGPPDNESESYTSSEHDSNVTRKGENSTPKEFFKKSQLLGAEGKPSLKMPYDITNGPKSQETSSIEPPPVVLSRLPSKHLWESVTGQQQLEAVASHTDLPASTSKTTGYVSSRPDVANAADSHHKIPKSTVKQLHGPPEREIPWYPPSKSTEDQMNANDGPTEKVLSANRLPDIGITTSPQIQETSSMGPSMGFSRLPSKRLWVLVNDVQPTTTNDWATKPGPVLTNVGNTFSHDTAIDTAVSGHTIPKATVKQLHGPPDRETQWYPPPERDSDEASREEYSSRTKSSQPYSWVSEKRLPSPRRPDFDLTTGYQRQETSIVRPPSGLSRMPSKRPWESSEFPQILESGNSVTKQLLSIEKLAETLISDEKEQYQLKEKQNVLASAVAPKTDPNFGPVLKLAHLLLQAAQEQAYGSSEAEMRRSSANDTERVSAGAMRDSELSRITKQLSFITQLLISGLLLNVLTSRQLQGSSLHGTSEELLGPTVPSLNTATATPDGASSYLGDFHYKDTTVWNASSESSTGDANRVPFFLRSWVSRPIPVVPLPEGVSEMVGEHPSSDGQPPPPPPDFPSEELEVQESVGGGLATSWQTTSTEAPETPSPPPSNDWDTIQVPNNYWNPTTTTTPSPYDYWYQNKDTTQYPHNYWDTTTTTTQSPYDYWYTNKDTPQNPYNYWSTTTSTTPSPDNYWNTNQYPHNYWQTTNATTPSPYDYWQTSTTTTRSPYNYWNTSTQDPYYWHNTPTTTTTKSPYDVWYDYWYGNATTTTKSPYEDWYNYWYSKTTTTTKSPNDSWYDYATTTTKSPYEDWYNYWYSKTTTTTKSPNDSWNDYWSKIRTTTTTSTSRPHTQYNWDSGWPTTTSPKNTEPPTTHRPWNDYWSTPTTTTSKPPKNSLSHYNGYYGWMTQSTPKSTEPPTTQRPWYDYWTTTPRPTSTQTQNNWMDSWKVPTTTQRPSTQRPWNDYWSTTSRPQGGQSHYNWYHNWPGTTTTTSTSQPPADFPSTTRSPWYDFYGTTKRPYAWYNSWGDAGPTTTTTTTTVSPTSQAQTTDTPEDSNSSTGEQPADQTHSTTTTTQSPTSQAQTTDTPEHSNSSTGEQPADETQSSDNVSSSSEKPAVQQSQGTHYNPDGSYVMDVPGHHEEGFFRVPAGGGSPVFVKKGYYTYKDGKGEQHTVFYVADENGYRTSGS